MNLIFLNFFYLSIGFLFFTGIGSFFSIFLKSIFRYKNNKIDIPENLYPTFGTMFFFFSLQIYNLFLPVNLTAVLILGTLSAIGLVLSFRKRTKRLIFIFFEKKFYLKFFITFLFAILAMNIVGNYDSGLYHIQSIKWANEYPVVSGLGNLHSRLAFNNTFFLLPAFFLNIAPLEIALKIVNPLLIFVFFNYVLDVLLSSKKKLDSSFFYLTSSLAPVSIISLRSGYFTSPTPDTVIILGSIANIYVLQKFILNKVFSKKLNYFAFTIFFSAILFSLKSSSALLSASTISIMIFLIFYRFKNLRWLKSLRKIVLSKVLAVSLLLSSINLIAWLITGFKLSGYPLYPISSLGINVIWKVPEKTIIDSINWIKAFGRNPNIPWEESLNSFNWVTYWWNDAIGFYGRYTLPSFFLIFVNLVLLVLAFFKIRKEGQKITVLSRKSLASFFSLISVIISGVIWFLTAPTIRFGIFYLIIFTLVLSALNLKIFWNMSIKYYRIGLVVFLLVVCSGYSVILLKKLPSSSENFYPKTNFYFSDSGTKIYYPIDSDQCFASELPCTWNICKSIELIKENEISSGFKNGCIIRHY